MRTWSKLIPVVSYVMVLLALLNPGGGDGYAAPTAVDANASADDTGRNVRDRDDQTLTPMNQSNDPGDLKLTRAIRKALMADKSLSTTAQNIKIMTVKGKVTLRGPVRTATEKTIIGKKAHRLAKGRVDNQLEVIVR